MMDMIASYGNPISPQPPPLNRSYEEPDTAELRGPSFQDYLKSPAKDTSSSPSQEGNSLEQSSRDRESRGVADRADRDKPASPAEENRLKESGKTGKREEGRAGAAETDENLSGKASKSARWGGQKNSPDISESLLKRGSLPEESGTENALKEHKKPLKATSPVTEEDFFARMESSPLGGDKQGTEAESLLVSLTGSAAETALDETVSRRDHKRDVESGNLKERPAGDGVVKVAGSAAPDTARLKIVSADNPENSIEVSLTDTRNRGKADAVDRRTSGNETVKNNEGLLNKSDAPPSGDTENGNVRVLELGGDSQERSGTPAAFSAKETKSAAASFGEILREKGISQVVRQTGILLKDDNHGEIKLILKPESLGKVRIQLNLEDNRIAGRILVENSNVRDVFNQNMDELQRALRESGFESAHLEVSVEGEASGQNQEGRRDPLRNQRMIAQAIEDGLPGIITLQREETLVNLMA